MKLTQDFFIYYLKSVISWRDVTFHPTTHKVYLQTSKAIILPKTKASCYSHHLSQSTLRETNWLFRVSGCNPYLNSYLIIYITTPLWNLTKRFMELHLSHMAPPWDPYFRVSRCNPYLNPYDEGLTPTKDGGTCLRRLSMFRKEVH